MRSRVQKVTPARAEELLAANTANRPLSKSTVHAFAEAMRRGDWLVTHQGIAFDTNGVLVDGQHRLAAVIEAELPVEMTVFTEVEPDTFDVLDTGKRRNAADVPAIEGEKSTTMLAAMVRTVWLYENRRDTSWSGGAAAVTNHQIVQTLEANPKIREFLAVGERIAAETGMIKSAAGAASYLIEHANKRASLDDWYEGIIDGAGLAKTDPRLMFRRTMFSMARRQAGVVQRRRDTREHVALYLKAFNAWATGEPLSSLRFTAREPVSHRFASGPFRVVRLGGAGRPAANAFGRLTVELSAATMGFSAAGSGAYLRPRSSMAGLLSRARVCRIRVLGSGMPSYSGHGVSSLIVGGPDENRAEMPTARIPDGERAALTRRSRTSANALTAVASPAPDAAGDEPRTRAVVLCDQAVAPP